MKKLFFILICFYAVSLASFCHSQDTNFRVSVDKNQVSLGDSIKLSVQFDGAQDFPAPKLPEIEGFRSKYIGPLTKWSFVNGVTSSSVTHSYYLLSVKEGKSEIPPLVITYKNNTYTSKPVQVEVVRGPIVQDSVSSQQGHLDLEDRVFVVMRPERNKIYKGQEISLTVKLYHSLPIRNIQLPKIVQEGFSVEKFGNPRHYQEQVGGILFNVMEFKTEIFGMRPGLFEIGPAEIGCDLLVQRRPSRQPSLFDDFFSRDFFDGFFGSNELYPIDLRSPKIPIEVMALPGENVPSDFSGAVGNFNMDIEAQPKSVRVGDPITLTVTIYGSGNFKTVEQPQLRLGDGFKIYEPEIRQEQGKKEFRYVIIPRDINIKEIPEISFSYFNVGKQGYEVVTKGPLPIAVEDVPESQRTRIVISGQQKTLEDFVPEKIGQDIVYIKDSLGKLREKGDYLYRRMIFKIFIFIPLLALISLFVFRKHQERLSTDIGYARRLRAPKKARRGLQEAKVFLDENNAESFYKTIFKTMQEYLGDKFHLASAGITGDVVDTVLRKRGLNQEILFKLKSFFWDCDRARYAPLGISRGQIIATFRSAEEIIDYLERNKS